MHFIDRGAEPKILAKYRKKYTQDWIDYVESGKGDKEGKNKQPSFLSQEIDGLTREYVPL